MAIACSTSAFKTDLDSALTQVKELDFAHVDLICIPQWEHVSLEALARDYDAQRDRIAAKLEKHQLQPVALNCGLPATYDRSDATVQKRLAQALAIAKLLKDLNIQVASFYPGYKVEDRPWEEVLQDAAISMRELLEIGAQAGVTFAIELHAQTPFENLQQCSRLLETVEELQVAYDPSHFAMQEIDLKQTADFLDRTVHVHLRDAGPGKMQMPMGQGTVDFDWLLGALKQRNYAGHISLEYLPGLPEGPEESLKALREKVQSLLG